MRLFRLSFPLLLLLALAGCDTAEDGGNGGETFPLPTPPNHRASFTYSVGTLMGGGTVDESASETSQDVINDDRFGPGDVASARIRSMSVELNMDQPLGGRVEVGQATLTLSAPGAPDRVVATASDFSMEITSTNVSLRRADLDVENADITEFLQQGTFTGTLTMQVDGATDGTYQFTVTFDVDIEVFV
ncbi:MAG: hypothetical protein AAGI91_05915 [Bacteroidota bacterium]